MFKTCRGRPGNPLLSAPVDLSLLSQRRVKKLFEQHLCSELPMVLAMVIDNHSYSVLISRVKASSRPKSGPMLMLALGEALRQRLISAQNRAHSSAWRGSPPLRQASPRRPLPRVSRLGRARLPPSPPRQWLRLHACAHWSLAAPPRAPLPGGGVPSAKSASADAGTDPLRGQSHA